MSYFRSVLRRFSRRRESSGRVIIEGLESRQLLSGSPALTGVHLVGAVHNVSGVVLTFNEALDPASAQDVNTYVFGRTPPKGSGGGLSLGDFFPFLARPKARAIKGGKIQWSSATYDDAAHTVTLAPIKPFNAQKFFRLLRVKGTGPDALKDPAGNVLNDGADTLIHWTKRQGKRVHYIDGDGDNVTLTLRGRGQMYVFLRNGSDRDATIFVDRANSASVLTGTVQQGSIGNGIANVAELEGAGGISTNLLTSTQFQVQSTEA